MIARKLIWNARYYSTSRALYRDIRVRFAPSPTGNIHLGGLRTALYNYIFARQNEGKFILRIEDTDQSRIVAGSADDIEETLEWAGLKPDESPLLGGSYGPYTQSERLNLYKKKAEDLVAAGKAYRCFCSPTRLDLLRKYQARNRQKPHYDGKCRHLKPSEIDEKLEETGGKFVIRFAIQPFATTFNDLIFGQMNHSPDQAGESDPIILKSDMFPTYHFANVVDDYTMHITHVLRGSEWLSSTMKHIQLYQAFGWSVPTFAHFPLITMEDGSKMSKRFNQSQVKHLREEGYRPLAILNFLTNIGGGVPKSKQDSLELWDLQSIIDNFSFDKVTCHAGSAELSKLNKYNSKDLQKAWDSDENNLLMELKRMLDESKIETDLNDVQLKAILDQYICGRIATLKELLNEEKSYIWRHPVLSWSLNEYKEWDLRKLISEVMVIIDEVDLEQNDLISEKLHKLADTHGVKWASFMKLLRKIMTNSEKGLPVIEIFKCLGKNRSLSYLRSGLKYAS